MRKQFRLSNEQLSKLLEACKPTPVMYLSGGKPMFDSPQENANRAWQALGKELDFDGMSVQPIGSDNHDFTAEVSEKP